ncbi:thioredoxin family protein [Haloferula sargassicola]|uniref:Thiol-disulfide oxidoreductase ResA n=1 Tax=Haloferula sargassicola TaxID=490096 RepID=A0ABP9UQM0_9BACT
MKLKASLAVLAAAALSAGSAFALEPGDQAPGFTLTSVDGKKVSLSDYEGKTVVLEWVNFGCPFVQKHYQSGNMPELQEKYRDQGVVWLSIESGQEGADNFPSAEKLAEQAGEAKNRANAILRDPGGEVGKNYGAKTTPHMFVITKEGKIAYEGGIDDKPDTKQESIESATNYVSAALDSLMAGKEVETKKAAPYGCGVKY